MKSQLSMWEAVESAFIQHGGCYLHDEAYSLLSQDWQRLMNLKSERLSPNAFEDLVYWGYADFLVEAVGAHDHEGNFKVRSCRQWYRIGTGLREEIEVSS